jgi:protein gp37
MNLTSIEWTTFSANPLKYRDVSGEKVWGCVHHSPGCINCYSEALAKRYGRGGPFNAQTMRGLTPFLDDDEIHKMRNAKVVKGVPVSGSKCFVGDMTDVFGEWVPDALLDELFATFMWRPDVTWQVLTKRADRMRAYSAGLAALSPVDRAHRWAESILSNRGLRFSGDVVTSGVDWPVQNVWMGVSCEDQKRTDDRLPHLLQTPAAVRFISAEPLLEGLDIAKHRPGALGLHLVIIGAESGRGARPCELWWIKNLVGQCRDAGVAPFVKQVGPNPAPRRIPYPAGGPHAYTLEPLRIRDAKGGDMSEWPEDLRVRQFPVAQQVIRPFMSGESVESLADANGVSKLQVESALRSRSRR